MILLYSLDVGYVEVCVLFPIRVDSLTARHRCILGPVPEDKERASSERLATQVVSITS